MSSIKKIYDKLYTPRVREIGRICFYAGLILEIIIFLLDRSSWQDVYQSYLFRVSFVFFVVKCLCTRYEVRDWAFIVLVGVFSVIAYRLSLKDEVVRACVFIIAMKDMDVRRTMKLDYFLTFAGVALLGILAISGIMGNVTSSGGYGSKAGAFMVEFGLGSANTWAIQAWLLAAMFAYLYHDRMRPYGYGIILVLGIIVYGLSKCRMAMVMFAFTAVAGWLLERFKRLRESVIPYLAGVLITFACMDFSIYAAATSEWWEDLSETGQRLNALTTGRISSIYAFENGGGVLENWKLFGAPAFTEYFDMGLVRLFWWYGIIPGALAVASVLLLFAWQHKRKDHAGFLLLISMMIFSLLEAHFISPFLARSWYLFLMGGAWHGMLGCLGSRSGETKRHIAFYVGALSKGGAERVFINLAEYFLSVGYDVTMITQYVKEDEYPLPKGASRVISDLTEEETRGRIHNFLARVLKLHRVIRETDADLLMTTMGKANFMAITCSAFLHTRVVVSVVAEPTLEYPTRVMRLLLQTLFGEADGIVMQTERQRSFLRYGLRRASVILPNSVNPAFVRTRHVGARRKTICMVGRMDENKNQAMAITAFAGLAAKHPGFKLELCGDGPLREALMDRSQELGILGCVEFPGVVSDLSDRLHDAWAFVLTSDTEGMPNTLLEAMSLGLACISTDCPCGGPAEVIENGVNGILVPVGDADALAGALGRIMDDAGFADSLGRNACESMKAYRPESVNARWREYFDLIMEG